MATLKGAILENVQYDFEDTEARETAQSALTQAETNTNDITTIETNVATNTTNIATNTTDITKLKTDVATAQSTAETAQATAEEKQNILSSRSFYITVPADSDYSFSDEEMEQLLGKPLSELKENDSWVLFWGNSSTNFIDRVAFCNLSVSNGVLTFSPNIMSPASTTVNASNHFYIDWLDTSNSHYFIYYAIPYAV